jgi:hypothetical protein
LDSAVNDNMDPLLRASFAFRAFHSSFCQR